MSISLVAPSPHGGPCTPEGEARSAQNAFFAYSKARLHGLIVPQPAPPEAASQNRTNKSPRRTCEPGACAPQMQNCTNEFLPGTFEPEERAFEPAPQPRRPPVPEPLAALRARLDALVRHGAATGPGDHDLLAAIRALKLPGAAPYRGPIDPALLDQVLAERRFEIGGLAWLQGFEPAATAGG